MTRKALNKWLATVPPVEGSHVYDVTDPRHVGTLLLLRPSGCLVEWHGTKWLSEGIPLAKLRRTPEA